MSKAYETVKKINFYNIQHRKGWKPSDYIGKPITLEHWKEEWKEFKEALSDYQKGKDTIEHVKEELSDVYACLLQTAYRLNINFEELENESIRKMKLRFQDKDGVLN